MNQLIWAMTIWVILAKPWFFTGPYLNRTNMVNDAQQAISKITPQDRVLTTSYFVPQISQRQHVAFAKQSQSKKAFNKNWTVFLLNPNQPGWGSKKSIQKRLLNQAKGKNWDCESWPSGLTLCRRPNTAT